MSRIMIAALVFALTCAGCSSLEGQKTADGCVLHEQTSSLAGVAWADCPVVAGRQIVPGAATGVIPAVAPIIGGAAIGTGLGVAGALVGNGASAVAIAFPHAPTGR